MPKFVNLLIATVFLVLTCYAGYNFVMHKRKAMESLTWPKSIATIVSSYVESGQRGGGNVAFYKSHVTYQFDCQGQSVGGSNVSFPNPRDVQPELAECYCKKYQIGLRVPVAYNPKVPAENVLEPGDNPTLIHEFYWAAGFCGAFLLILFLNKDY